MVYFILGMIAVQALFPILDGLTSTILAGLEVIKGYFSVKISEFNRKISSEDEPKRKRPMGFVLDQEDEDE